MSNGLSRRATLAPTASSSGSTVATLRANVWDTVPVPEMTNAAPDFAWFALKVLTAMVRPLCGRFSEHTTGVPDCKSGCGLGPDLHPPE